MSKLTEWAFGMALLLIVLLGCLYGFERRSSVKAVAEAKVATDAAVGLSEDLQKAHDSFRIDLDAIQTAQDQKDELTEKAKQVEEKVDAIKQKVDKGQLSSAAADAAYLDSMWETYCQRQTDPACSTRSPRSGHKG